MNLLPIPIWQSWAGTKDPHVSEHCSQSWQFVSLISYTKSQLVHPPQRNDHSGLLKIHLTTHVLYGLQPHMIINQSSSIYQWFFSSDWFPSLCCRASPTLQGSKSCQFTCVINTVQGPQSCQFVSSTHYRAPSTCPSRDMAVSGSTQSLS